MADRKKSRLKSILCQAALPDRAEPGAVFHSRDTDDVWMATVDGRLVNLTDLFSGHAPTTDGPVFRTCGVPGPQGPKGERGDLTVVGDAELAEAVKTLRAQKARVLALLQEKLESTNHPAGVRALLHAHFAEIKKAVE
jgi:hypothetical protein